MPVKVDCEYHFDGEKVKKMVNSTTRKALNRAGGYTRKIAKRSIASKSGASAPGKPPHGHSGLLRNFIFYSYDPTTKSVVIGPQKIDKPRYGEAPHALEYGGTVSGYTRPLPKIGEWGIMRILAVKPMYKGRARKYDSFVRDVFAFGRAYEIQEAKIRSEFQLRRAIDNHKTIYGDGSRVTIGERPFMRPALVETTKNISQFFSR